MCVVNTVHVLYKHHALTLFPAKIWASVVSGHEKRSPLSTQAQAYSIGRDISVEGSLRISFSCMFDDKHHALTLFPAKIWASVVSGHEKRSPLSTTLPPHPKLLCAVCLEQSEPH